MVDKEEKDKIITEVESYSSRPDGDYVTVSVTAPVGLNELMEWRARARALVAAGVISASVSRIEDIPRGQIRPLTDLVQESGDMEPDMRVSLFDRVFKKREYVIKVNTN